MLGLRSHDKLLVSYDIGDDFAQVSYTFPESEEAETLSSVAGAENYNIPAVLCKRPGVNQWFYGKEAIRYAREQDGILVQNLLSMAVDGEPVQIEGKSYEPAALLALFMKRSLGMLSQVSAPDKIYAMVVTCEQLEHRVLEVLGQAVSGLRLKTDRIFFQSHMESYYNYMIRQPAQLWTDESILCDYRRDRILVYRLECNKRTTPVVAFIENREYPFLSYEPMPEAESLRAQRLERLDKEFLSIAQEVCGSRNVNSCYLIGDWFSEEWMKESLQYLCRGRRVFQGNNLYGKGACYGLQEKFNASEAGKSHVFLGNDKLRANIGMKVFRQGEESYYALLDAGVNWFEADQTLEFYIQDGNCIEVMVTPLIGKGNKLAQVILEDLQGGLCRLKAHFYMAEENRLAVEIEDLGLGEFRPATGRIWKEEITIY